MGFVNTFSEEEIELLKNDSFSNTELAKMLNRSYRSIIEKRKALRNPDYKVKKKAGPVSSYTDEQIEMIRAKEYTDDELAAMFGKTRKAIATKRYDLNRQYRGDKRHRFDYVDTNEL